MTRRAPLAVVVSDEDQRALQQLDADPQARQLLRWFSQLPPDARAEVHALARRRYTGLARPSFHVIALDTRGA